MPEAVGHDAVPALAAGGRAALIGASEPAMISPGSRLHRPVGKRTASHGPWLRPGDSPRSWTAVQDRI